MSDLQRMRRIATGALVGMALIYVIARTLQTQIAGWGYLAAFAEAAMVGALADWFAVVALFRHPMGIPIPHTAIIPTNKDRIGRTLANFVVTNFLTGESIRQRLEKTDLTAKAAEWLWTNAKDVSDRIVAAAPALGRALRDEDVRRLLNGTLLAKLRAIEVAPLAGKVLKTVIAGEVLDEVIGASVGLAEDLVVTNRALIEAQVRKRIPLPDLLGISFVKDRLGRAIAEKVSVGILEDLQEMRRNERHPFRLQLLAKALELAEALQQSEAYRDKGERIKEEILQHPAVRAHLSGLVRDLVRDFEADLAAPDSRIRAQVERAVIGAAHLLMEDHALRAKLNGWLGEILANAAEQHGEEASQFIQDRVRKWDAVQLTQKIEEAVGRDLQYVRLNGTIVGGLVGLLIYTVSKWLL
jgi:uncharacterized membrane-anchored protein YjiN (DUF445 family)